MPTNEEIEKLSKELSKIGNIDGWQKMVEHVHRLLRIERLRARIEELNNFLAYEETLAGQIWNHHKQKRIAELTRQLEEAEREA